MQPCGVGGTNSKFGISVDALVPAVMVMAAVSTIGLGRT